MRKGVLILQYRQRQHHGLVGRGSTLTIPTGHVDTWPVDEDERYINDYYGKKKDKVSRLLPPSDLEADRTRRSCPRFSTELLSWKHKNVPAGSWYYPGMDLYQGRFGRDSTNGIYALQTLAKSHPFRSEFSIPTTIAEMLDIGSLFSLTAKSFSELIGNSYLQYKFGYVQFVQDIKTLAGITTSIERRIKEFDSLGKKGGLRRKIFLDHNSVDRHEVWPVGWFWSVFGVSLGANIDSHETVKIYGTVRWRWKPGITVSLSKLEAFNLAVKTVFDLGQLDASTIWNSIPWTWLADYFFDISNWLQANENSDLVEWFDLCICREHKTTSHAVLTKHEGDPVRVYPGKFSRVRFARDVIPYPPTIPPFRYSLLSKSQALVLLALYGKFRGGHY